MKKIFFASLIALTAMMIASGARAAESEALRSVLDTMAYVPREMTAGTRELIRQRGFLWPVDGSIFSTFKASRGRRAHGAVDIRAPKDTPVAAAHDGIVSIVSDGGRGFRGYGKTVVIDHGSGVHTVYAHLNSYTVKMGEKVARGQVIGAVGKTGKATNYLLHYEVRLDGRKIDPLLCMEDRPGAVKMVNYRSPQKSKK